MLVLRPWQAECKNKALTWFENGNKTFLMNVAPGEAKQKLPA